MRTNAQEKFSRRPSGPLRSASCEVLLQLVTFRLLRWQPVRLCPPTLQFCHVTAAFFAICLRVRTMASHTHVSRHACPGPTVMAWGPRHRPHIYIYVSAVLCVHMHRVCAPSIMTSVYFLLLCAIIMRLRVSLTFLENCM